MHVTSRTVFRVAMLLLDDMKHYCFNSRRITGWQTMKKRHLEIMGYKVVQVRHVLYVLTCYHGNEPRARELFD